MEEEKKIDITIDLLTAQELEKKGNLKFMDFGGTRDYIAVYEGQHYILRTRDDKKYYELLRG